MSEDGSPAPPPAVAEDQASIAEQDAIRVAVAEVALAWANAEESMVSLLGAILNNASKIPSAIYFTPAALEVRIDLIDNALRALLAATEVQEPLLKRWDPIMLTLASLRETRSAVTRGQIVTYGSGSEAYYRLANTLTRFDDAHDALLRKGERPGLGPDELKLAAEAVGAVAQQIDAFHPYVTMLGKGDYATLTRRLEEAEGKGQSSPDPVPSPIVM